MCGIFGQGTDDPKKINQANIKILGMYNESRGKNSCGITVDSEIYHGLLLEKEFSDFMKGRNFTPSNNPLVFGHTRSASSGSVNEFNSHPFGFGTNRKKDGYKVIGVHNGTLYNHEELAKRYEINMEVDYINGYNVKMSRTKIDSEVLLEILYKTRRFDVLGEYIGRAALVWTDTNKPNITYLWSGKSRSSEHYVAGVEVEERPMNVWVENDNSFYFSSLPESLEAIGATTAQVNQIDYNTVYTIKDGNFNEAMKTEVSRKQCFHTETYVSKHASTNYNSCGYQGKLHGEGIGDAWDDMRDPEFRKTIPGNTANLNTSSITTKELTIYNDVQLLNQNDYGDKIYNKMFRFYHKGHLVTNICAYIPDYGFVKLGETITEARTMYDKCRGIRFVNNEFDYKNEIKEGGLVPIPFGKAEPLLYYFIDGIQLHTFLDYASALGSPHIRNSYEKMSHMSVQPVIDLTFAYKSPKKQDIYKDGKLFTGTVNGLSYEKVYTVIGGNLTGVIQKTLNKISKIDETLNQNNIDTERSLFNPEILKDAHDEIVLLESEIEKDEVEKGEIQKLIDLEEAQEEDAEEVIETMINEMIDAEITPCLMSFQNCREELEQYPQTNEKVKMAKGIIGDLILTINKFVN